MHIEAKIGAYLSPALICRFGSLLRLAFEISRWSAPGRFILAVGRIFAVYNPEQKRDDASTPEQNMAKGYWVTTYRSISNPDALAAYAKLAAPALTAAGGRFLARGTPVKTMEQRLMQGTVLIEFPSVEQAITASNFPVNNQAPEAPGENVDQ